MRRGLPEILARNAHLVIVGPSGGANASRAFRHYLGELPTDFHYLCDSQWHVHRTYGLQSIGPVDAARMHADTAAVMLRDRPLVAPLPSEMGRIITNWLQQGTFAIDEDGIVRFAT